MAGNALYYFSTPLTLTNGDSCHFQADSNGYLKVAIASGGAGAYTGPLAAQLPSSLGAKTGANSLSIVPASDATFAVGGVQARGAAITVNPVLVGGRGSSAIPSTVTSGQLVDLFLGTSGQMIIGTGGSTTTPTATFSAANMISAQDGAARPNTTFSYISDGASAIVPVRSVVGAANTSGTGTVAIGMPLWSATDTTQARVNASASGDTVLVAAVSGQTTRVYALRLSVAGAVVVQIKTGSTVQEVFNFAGAGGAVVLDLRDRPYYKTGTNEALNINLSAAVQVDGRLEYVTSA